MVLMSLGWSVAAFWSVFRQIWVLVPLSVWPHIGLGAYRVFLFSALWSVFKQVLGACTLDVRLRLVCSGLRLVGGFLPSQPLLAVD